MAIYNTSNSSFQTGNQTLMETMVLAHANGDVYSADPTGGNANAVLAAVISSNNSTTANLAGGATFTGAYDEVWKYGSISVVGASNANGTLYFDFSTDGTNLDRAVQISNGTSGNFGIHSLTPIAKFGRIRLVNGATDQSYLRVQTIYNPGSRIAFPTSRLAQPISNYMDVLNVRSMITDDGGLHNAYVTDHNALQVTPPMSGKTGFGDALVAELTPITGMLFNYHIDSNRVYRRENNSGAVVHANNMAWCYTGGTANSYASIISKRGARYQPGVGLRGRFTAVFTAGVANTTQVAGIGDPGDGLFFGYNGTSFGVMHRKGGEAEIRTLTITTKSSHADSIDITLNGVVKAVTVTNGADATVTANEIAAADYSDTGKGWTARAVGNRVTFLSWVDEPLSGTYSLTNATSAVGTFSVLNNGVAATETWVPQTSWNGEDKFDGTGVTGMTLDPTKGNVYQVVYQYLGFGGLYFYIEEPDDGEFHLVHTIRYANEYTTPSLGNPSLPLYMAATNLEGTTANVAVRSASMGLFADGKDEAHGQRRAVNRSITLGATAAETPILSLRVTDSFQGKSNKGKLKIQKVSCSAEHSKPVTINFYSNPTLVGASWANVETNVSMAQIDSTATSFTGGTLVFSVPLGKTGNQVIDFDSDLYAGYIVTGEYLTATIAPKSGNAAEAVVSIQFVELV